MAYKLERLMHLTHEPSHPDARAVEADDPEGHFVLGGPGAEIPDADAKRYGLTGGGRGASEAKHEDAPPETKAVEHAPENKAAAARTAGRK